MMTSFGVLTQVNLPNQDHTTIELNDGLCDDEMGNSQEVKRATLMSSNV